MTTNRKYENGYEFINEKGLKFCDIDFYKFIITRKEKAKKTDTCVKYLCYFYDNKGNFEMCVVLKETTIDAIVGE